MKYAMKLFMYAVCTMFCLLAATACSSGNSGENTQTSPETTETAVDLAPSENVEHDADADTGSDQGTPRDIIAAASLSMEADMGISIDGQWFPIWQDARGLLQALGADFSLTAAPSCAFEGEDKEFAYDNCYVFTNPDGDRDIWYGILLESDTYATSRGIRVGSTLAETIEAYGDSYYWEGESILTYSISGEQGDISSPCIIFTVVDESIAAIEIYYPTNTI